MWCPSDKECRKKTFALDDRSNFCGRVLDYLLDRRINVIRPTPDITELNTSPTPDKSHFVTVNN